MNQATRNIQAIDESSSLNNSSTTTIARTIGNDWDEIAVDKRSSHATTLVETPMI